MSWECRRCNSFTADGQKHECIYDAFEAMQARAEAAERERDELRAKPPMFIKLDETTEAFAQARAAIENMKMFQLETYQLREKVASLEALAEDHEDDWKRIQDAERERDQLRRDNDGLLGAIQRLNLTEQGTPCFCAIAIGDPRMTDHSSSCKFVVEAIEKYEGKK